MRWIPVIFAVALAACSGSKKADPAIDPTIFPKNYKNEIIESMPQLIDEVDGFKDSGATDPVLATIGTGQAFVVCIRGNPRTSTQGYLGNKVMIAYFIGGKINQLVPTSDERCTKAAYKPFPELDKYCRGATCSGRR